MELPEETASGAFRDVIGHRGEKIFELRLTAFEATTSPLFRPAFLGDKWPGIDYYVELAEHIGKRPYFLAQVKATRLPLNLKSKHLTITTKKSDIDLLLKIPGPTYLFGVHEPTQRVFVRSIHLGMPVRSIRKIETRHELNSVNLRSLYDEVQQYWSSQQHKPLTSRFA